MRSTLCFILLCGCSGSIDSPRSNESDAPIIGGTTDSADPAVVMLYANSGSICTATVISSTTLLTAAHCVSPQTVGNTTFQAYFGADANKGGGTWAAIKETHYDTRFDVNNLGGGHDVAVAILANPTSVTPKAVNRSSSITALVGQAVRLVGYGLNNGSAQTGAGTKRQVSTRLNQVTGLLLSIGNSSAETCNGDSGGPAFMTIGGVETLVGVTSFGQVGCTGGGYDTRIDIYSSFIDQYVRGGAPPPPSCTPSCSGKNCGDDGCGGSCGSCTGGATCNSTGQCEAPPPASGSSCDANGGWESEGNNSPATANQLCSDGHIDGAIDASGDVDWYAWSVGANVDYYVTLSYLPQDYNMTLYKVVNGSLSSIATALDNHDGADQQIARHTSDGGTYYLKVFGVGGAFDASWGYRVTVQVQ
jgi:V8-like Glu-specific endopeptidase